MAQFDALIENSKQFLWGTAPKTENKAEDYLGRSLQQLKQGARLLAGAIGSTIIWSTIIKGTLAAENFPQAFARRTGNHPIVVGNISTQIANYGQNYSLSILPTDFFMESEGFTLNVFENGNKTLPSWLNFKFDSLDFLGSYDTPGYALDVKVVNNIAYIADGASGLQILNVSNPRAPYFLGAYNSTLLFRPTGIDVVGNVAYVVGNDLKIFDISSASNPTLMGESSWSMDAKNIQVVNSLAYVADWYDGLQIIDVSNSTDPTLITKFTSYFPNPNTNDVHVVGNLVYLVNNGRGLDIIDVSISSAPSLLVTYNVPGGIRGKIDVVGDLVYLADSFDGLKIINVTNSSAPFLIGTFLTPGQASAVKVIGEMAFVTMGYYVQAIDVSNPYTPVSRELYVISNNPGSLPLLNIYNVGSLIYITEDNAASYYPSALKILEEKFILTGLPGSLSNVRNYSLELVAQDPEMNQASIPFLLEVIAPPLVIGYIPYQNAEVGQNYNYAIPNTIFMDPMGEPLTLSARNSDGSSLPAWLSFDGTTLEGTPGDADLGFHYLEIDAQDPDMNQVSAPLTLFVNDHAGDNPNSHNSKHSNKLLPILLPVHIVAAVAGIAYKCFKRRMSMIKTNTEMVTV